MNLTHALRGLAMVCAIALGLAPALAQELPRIERRGQATQLIVDGKPYLALAGELHNSSPSSPAYMAPIWDRLQRAGLKTVIGVASWEMLEPGEGQFNFDVVDDQIKQARQRGMRLVLLWFGAYKNAESTYAPSWVRRDERRFPRAVRDPNVKLTGIAAYLRNGTALSVFNDRLAEADARAFAALMRHLAQVDREHTVIMVQVENEVGLLGDSRDRSALAQQAWAQPVPEALMRYLQTNRAALQPHLRDVWSRNGFRQSGSWSQVFGTDKAADEIFMAWGFGRYADRIARAGLAHHRLPMYANAWLGPQPQSPEPGDYPSGGPVSRMMDVWKAAAPSMALLAPDIYIDDFNSVLAAFHRRDNPIFVPEAKTDAGNLFVALGQYHAIGFSPFGIEDVAEDHDVFKAYRVLGSMSPQILEAQQEGRVRGFRTSTGSQQQETLGGYTITIRGPRATAGLFGAGTGTTAQTNLQGYGLVISSGRDEFLVVARAASLQFASPDAQVELDFVQEGKFEGGTWIPGRTFNGDERHFMFPDDALRIVKVRLLRR